MLNICQHVSKRVRNFKYIIFKQYSNKYKREIQNLDILRVLLANYFCCLFIHKLCLNIGEEYYVIHIFKGGKVTEIYIILVKSHVIIQNIRRSKHKNGNIIAFLLFLSLISSSNSYNWAATWKNQQSECAPSEDSDQPGHPASLIRVFAVRVKKDWADAQAHLSLRWAHTHFVGFVISWLI